MADAPIYLDHAASTPVRLEVLEAMLPYLGGIFGNPSSMHRQGRAARAGLEAARGEVAGALGVQPGEVYFTSGGTEADNLAILGRAFHADAPARVAVAATEHKAVLAAAHAVRERGGEELILPVDARGMVDGAAFDRALAARPAVVSIMWVNNETGVIQDIPALAARAHAAGIPFHSDLVQAFGKLPLTLAESAVSLATVSAHKLGGPKGVGALFVREGVGLAPLITGGGQQRGVRPGTENIAGAVGLGRAAALATAELAREGRRLAGLRAALVSSLKAAVPDLVVVGDHAPAAPHVVALLVPGAEAGALLAQLDQAGIAAASGSACASGATTPSHVLLAMGIAPDLAGGFVRLSLGRGTTEDEIVRTIALFPEAVARVRRLAGALARG